MRFGSLFSGLGGLDLGFERVGMKCAFQVEIDSFCRKILERHWPDVPKYDDVRKFPADDAKFDIDLLAGGFPCFPAGTLVETESGRRRIENVCLGDLVLTHRNRLRMVTGTMRRVAKGFVTVRTLGEPPLMTTAEHPFLAANPLCSPEAAWLPAFNLGLGDLLAQPAGYRRGRGGRSVIQDREHAWVRISEVSFERNRTDEVFNIEVEEDDTYVAGSYVVHNCKQVSNARTAQVAVPEGLEGKDSGLWFEMGRIIRRMRPRWIVIENVGSLATRGLDTVLWEISKCGYDATWQTVSAGLLGAPHLRRRLFIVGVQNTYGEGLEGHVVKILAHPDHWRRDAHAARSDKGDPTPRICGGASGISPRLVMAKQRLTALGNAVVPKVGEFIGKRILEADKALFGENGNG